MTKKEWQLDEAHEARVKQQKYAERWAHENDFVYIDHAFRPYRVRMTSDGLWLHYWTAGKTWATLRKIEPLERDEMLPFALPESQEKLYEAGVPFFMDKDAPLMEE